jgi:hypothetical protein
MNKKLIILAALLLNFISINTTFAQYVSSTDKLPDHPRLFLLKGEEAELKNKIASNKDLKAVNSAILAESDRMISLPCLTRNQEGMRILSTSREAIRRIFFLSYAYRMTSQEKYLKRAEKEMLAMAALENWNPTHFLDVAEMTFGMSIGYDWLFDKLTASSREIVATAIHSKGIEQALNPKYLHWLKASNNWNPVCNTGISSGALALFEKYPEESAGLINRAINSIKLPMNEYRNNGAYREGYAYWNYGTGYNAFFLNMLESLWKSDFGLSKAPGFMSTAKFVQNMEGPATALYSIPMRTSIEEAKYQMKTQCFNFSDCVSSVSVNPPMFWFASKSNDLSLLYNEVKKLNYALENNDRDFINDRFLPMLLIWAKDISFEKITVPKERMYAAQGLGAFASMRTSWTDPNAIALNVRAGSILAGHSHMDIGSFILDAEGVRWAMDFGLQSYGQLEAAGINLWIDKQESTRWDVFRYNNKAHNTLTINDHKQLVKGEAPLENICEKPDRMSVSMNLTSLYENDVKSVQRGVGLMNNKYVLIQDKFVTGDKADTIRWNMLTTALPKIIDNKTILLTQNGKKLLIVAEGDAEIKSRTWSTKSPNRWDADNTGTIYVGFEIIIPANTEKLISTCLIPGGKKLGDSNHISLFETK